MHTFTKELFSNMRNQVKGFFSEKIFRDHKGEDWERAKSGGKDYSCYYFGLLWSLDPLPYLVVECINMEANTLLYHRLVFLIF